MLAQIDEFLRRTGMPRTLFGRRAINDPRLVDDLRHGRQLRPETARRVLTYLREYGA